MSDDATLTIASIAAGGAGVGRHEGRAVFVPRTAPGDRVRVRLQARRKYAIGELLAVEAPGPDRVEPRCPHFVHDRCGGCQLQHVALGAQRSAKADIVRQALARIARRVTEPPEVRAAGEPWRYRNKLTLTARRRADGGWRAGLRRFDDPDALFDLRECHISDAAIEGAWGEVRQSLEHLPGGSELRLVLRAGGEGVSLVVEGGAQWTTRDLFVAGCPSLARVRHDPASGPRDDDDATASLGAFAQVNPRVAATLFDHVLARAQATGARRVVDAYGGQGELAQALAATGARVTLIEFDPEATRVARARSRDEVTVVTARVEDVMARALPADLVVLNPPRDGVDARVCTALERPAVARHLLYVSCDPATLARDLSRLPSWTLREVTAFDMFPQTAHVETVCLLTREEG